MTILTAPLPAPPCLLAETTTITTTQMRLPYLSYQFTTRTSQSPANKHLFIGDIDTGVLYLGSDAARMSGALA